MLGRQKRGESSPPFCNMFLLTPCEEGDGSEPGVHPFPILEGDLAGPGGCSSSWVLWVPQKARMGTLFLPAYKGSVVAGW